MPRLIVITTITLFISFVSVRAADQPGATTKPSTADSLPSLSHSSVSIPWEDLRGLLEKNGAGDKPPVDFAYSPALYEATVTDKGVTVSVSTGVTLLVDGWTLAPIGPANTGVTAATVDGQPAPLVIRGDGLFVLIKSKGEKKILLSMMRDVVADGGSSRIDLPLMPSPLVTVSATIPQTNLSAGAPGGSGVIVTQTPQATLLKGTFHGGATATITWRPLPPAGVVMEPRAYVDSETLVTLEKGLMRTSTQVSIALERAPMPEMKFDVDPALVVLAVKGEHIAQWRELPAAGPAKPAKTLIVSFASGADHERAINIIAERDLPEAGGEIEFHPPVMQGAKRDRGFVAVGAVGTFEARPGKSSAERVSVSELPADLRPHTNGPTSAVQIGYHYESPSSITLLLEKIKKQPAQVLATTMSRVAVERGVFRCQANISYEILHAGVDTLRVGLPDGVEIDSVKGLGVRDNQTVADGAQRTLVIGLSDLAVGKYELSISYVARFDEAKNAAPSIPLLTNVGAVQDRGFIGIEVRDSVEITPTLVGGQRIDVKELPEAMWTSARSPLLFGYRYDTPGAKLTLAITRNADVDVLVAMSDVCEVSTTYTPDGKCITKMMLVTRNNLKQYMTLKMPEGAQIWSAFVDDHPVTPAKNAKGDVLIPLKKSEPEDMDDDDAEDGKSYRARRDRRRAEGLDHLHQVREKRAKLQRIKEDDGSPPDLKPYDVEIVFVTPTPKLADHGQIHAALPQSDVPIGHLSWAIFLPTNLRVVDTEGNVAEVSRFTLGFRHFGDVADERNANSQKALAEALQQAAQELAKAAEAQAQAMADRAKAAGVLPVRIEIPMIGQIHRFEKFLTVDEGPAVTLTYKTNP